MSQTQRDDVIDLMREVATLKKQNAALLAACEAFLEKWNRQGLGGFQLEKFDGVAVEMRAAIESAEPKGE